MNDIYIAEIFQHGRWKLSLNVRSTQSDRETDCTETERKKDGRKIS
jgi:hypothetical protein